MPERPSTEVTNAAATTRVIWRVVVADDDVDVLESMSQLLGAAGFHVIGTARDGLTTERLVAAGDVDLVLCDTFMPGGGVGLVRALSAVGPNPPIVVAMSGAAPPSLQRRLLGAGASRFAQKGIDDIVGVISSVTN